MTKLDRLARSVPDARDIVDELTVRGVRLKLGGSIPNPADPIGRLLFTVLSMIAKFEPTSPAPAPAKASPSPKPKAGSAANSPSSPRPAPPRPAQADQAVERRRPHLELSTLRRRPLHRLRAAQPPARPRSRTAI